MSVSDEKDPKKPAAPAAEAGTAHKDDGLRNEQLDGVAGGVIIEPIITRREVRGGAGRPKPGGTPRSPTSSFMKPEADTRRRRK